MESPGEIIRIKVRNTLVSKDVTPIVLDWVREKERRDPKFRACYYSSNELVDDLKTIEDLRSRRNVIEWLKSKHSRNPIIVQAIGYFTDKENH